MSDFKLTRYRIKVNDGLRGPQQPFSAILLSDLHNALYGEGNSVLLQAIRNERPEAVFVAGDMLVATQEPQMDAALALMGELTKQYPVYYVEGNHEYKVRKYAEVYGGDGDRFFEAIQSFGVHLLKNSCERIDLQKMPITVWGLELPWQCYRRFRKNELTAGQITELLGARDEGRYNILLAHNPVYFEAYAAWGAELTLAGHLHGGVIRLPYFGGVVTPQFRLFPKYDRGIFKRRGKLLVVSAGLGSHSIPIRINNPPELVVLDIS